MTMYLLCEETFNEDEKAMLKGFILRKTKILIFFFLKRCWKKNLEINQT